MPLRTIRTLFPDHFIHDIVRSLHILMCVLTYEIVSRNMYSELSRHVPPCFMDYHHEIRECIYITVSRLFLMPRIASLNTIILNSGIQPQSKWSELFPSLSM
jgi:hypothetical protein